MRGVGRERKMCVCGWLRKKVEECGDALTLFLWKRDNGGADMWLMEGWLGKRLAR